MVYLKSVGMSEDGQQAIKIVKCKLTGKGGDKTELNQASYTIQNQESYEIKAPKLETNRSFSQFVISEDTKHLVVADNASGKIKILSLEDFSEKRTLESGQVSNILMEDKVLHY